MSMEMNGFKNRLEDARVNARKRIALFILFTMAAGALYSKTLLELYNRSLESELYSHIPLIPLMSAYFFYLKRLEISSNASYCFKIGLPLIFSAYAACLALGFAWKPDVNVHLAATVFSAILFWAGGFMAFYGKKASRASVFPLLFLLFIVPVPEQMLDPLIVFLQERSADVAWFLFNLSGSPVQRDGMFFHLPGITIEVAKECSGIRSSLALFIAGVIAAKMFLSTWHGRLSFIAILLPIAILKNGIRITALTLAGYHFDERVFYGSLHTRGGIIFFMLALIISGVVLWVFTGLEGISAKRKAARAG